MTCSSPPRPPLKRRLRPPRAQRYPVALFLISKTLPGSFPSDNGCQRATAVFRPSKYRQLGSYSVTETANVSEIWGLHLICDSQHFRASAANERSLGLRHISFQENEPGVSGTADKSPRRLGELLLIVPDKSCSVALHQLGLLDIQCEPRIGL